MPHYVMDVLRRDIYTHAQSVLTPRMGSQLRLPDLFPARRIVQWLHGGVPAMRSLTGMTGTIPTVR